MKRTLHCLLISALLTAWPAGSVCAADPDVASLLISYQYLDSIAEPPEQPNIVSSLVSYQYLDSLVEAPDQPNVVSPLVSFQYLDWPGDENLTFETSPLVSFYYHGPPLITLQPGGTIAKVGTNVIFTVEAQGSPPLNYQWRFNGIPLTGAEAPILPLSGVQLTNAGDYSVAVSNPYGTANSAVARLYVYLAPATPQPQPPTAISTTQPAPPELTAKPRKPSSTQLVVFTGGGLVYREKMTVVLTHGWKRSATCEDGCWPAEMARALISKAFDANVVAWDWRENADTRLPSTAAARTCSEGEALGSELLYLLGANYGKPIHFIGHSLGTLVNCRAADFIHGDAKNSPGRPPGSTLKLNPQNTHMTLFDEAELVTALNGVHVFIDVLVKPTGDTTADLINNFWAKVIPDQSAWIDNYLSEVGLLHTEAANVLLWRESTLNPVKPHGYAYGWYQKTIGDPTASDMGHRWSFERDSLRSAPRPGTYFMQSALVNEPELEVVEISDSLAAALAGGYGVGLNRLVAYPTLKAYQGLAELGGLVIGGVKDGIRYVGDFAGRVTESFTALNGQPVFVGTGNSTPAYYLQPSASTTFQAGWDLEFVLQAPLGPQLRLQANNTKMGAAGSGGTNTSAYVWLPVSVPRDAVGVLFQFRLEGAATNEFFTMGISNENYFTMESKFVEDGQWVTTGVITIPDYAGQDVELFFSLNGDGPPIGRLSVRGIQFYTPALPHLKIGVSNGVAVLSWPVSAVGWQVQAQDVLCSSNLWTTITNPPAVLDYQNTMTWPISEEAKFFRLMK